MNLTPAQLSVASALGLLPQADERSAGCKTPTPAATAELQRGATSHEMSTDRFRVQQFVSEGDLVVEEVKSAAADKTGKQLPPSKFFFRVESIGESEVCLTQLKYGEEIGAHTRPLKDFIDKKFKKTKKVQTKAPVGDSIGFCLPQITQAKKFHFARTQRVGVLSAQIQAIVSQSSHPSRERAVLPELNTTFLKHNACAYASLAMSKRAHKLTQLVVEIEVLDDPRQVRVLRDFDKGDLIIQCSLRSSGHMPRDLQAGSVHHQL